MHHVISSNLAAVGYDPRNRELFIRFHNGGLYAYFDVPESEYHGLVSAISKGGYHYRNIRNRYRYRRL